ncbi:hypothetical protein BKA62DRAFT_704087 [Auriculariales sp. MPI-PUGE-AT-0066]|nr:hypothetical protein BKA62DRAFT_704087 [Auriculariales sp. MPI-PUGE-AT-0066]
MLVLVVQVLVICARIDCAANGYCYTRSQLQWAAEIHLRGGSRLTTHLAASGHTLLTATPTSRASCASEITAYSA